MSVGWLFIAVSIPQVALSVLFGRLTDRIDRRTLCITADLISAATAFALPVWLWMHQSTTLGSYLCNLLLACSATLFMPASNALVKERIRDDLLVKYNARYERDVKLAESGIKAMQEYAWPGNVRQLQHLIERLTILAPRDRIDGEAIADALTAMEPREHAGDTLVEAETEQIRRVLAATGGNKSRAAQILGIERKTLYRKLERMKL